MPLDVESGCANGGQGRTRPIDPIRNVLCSCLIGRRCIGRVEVFQIFQRIRNSQTVNPLKGTLYSDVDGLSHGQTGRVPIGGQCIGRDGHARASHAGRTRTDHRKFHRERMGWNKTEYANRKHTSEKSAHIHPPRKRVSGQMSCSLIMRRDAVKD
jgi:hypothetical protein